MKKVVILGAGISGLVAAWTLSKQKNCEVTLLEASDRVGGSIQTSMSDGFLFEKGPRTIALSSEVTNLIDELDLKKELIFARTQRRFVFNGEKLIPLSNGSMLKAALFSKKHRPKIDESIETFCTHTFGPKFTRNFIDPLVRGIFAGNIETLSMQVCLPHLWRGAKFPSRMKLVSFREGLETLPKRLFERLQGRIDLRLNTAIFKLDEVLDADHIISALPAWALQPLLNETSPFLEATPYRDIALVHLGFSGEILPRKGFGFLVPSWASASFLGMSWDSSIFPSHNRGAQTRLTLFYTHPPSINDALEAVKTTLKLDRTPQWTSTTFVKKAIPQYLVGHLSRQSEIKLLPHLSLIGNTVAGPSLSRIIAHAQALSKNIF